MAENDSKSTPTKTAPAKAAPAPARSTQAGPDVVRAEPGVVISVRNEAEVGDSTEGGNLATDGNVVSSTAVPGVDVDAQDKAIEEAGSWDRADHVIGEGVFHDEALTGAGTILPGGGYGPPLPDPQVQAKNADPDYQVK